MSRRFRGLLFGLILVWWALAARAGSGRLTYQQYSELSGEKRAALMRAYVKRAEGYYQVSLSSYLVRTDISAERALAHAVEMDEFHRCFSSIFVGPFKIRARPELYVMKTKTSYANAYNKWACGMGAMPGWSAGLFATLGPNKHALFGCAEYGAEELHETLFHEGTHQLLQYYVGDEIIPRWFDEGCATNFQTWTVARSPQRNIHEEIWKSEYPEVLCEMKTGKVRSVTLQDGTTLTVGAGGVKPDLLELMNTTPTIWLGSANPTPLYAQGWGFVNFLLAQGDVGQKYFNYLIMGCRQGRGEELKRLMPERDRQGLAAEWNKYLDNTIVPHVEFSRPVAALLAKGRKAEAAAILAEGLKKHRSNPELLYFKGLAALEAGKAKEAYKILKPLEKKRPRHPELYRVLGRAALEAGDRFKARKYLEEAMKEDYADEEAKKLHRRSRGLR